MVAKKKAAKKAAKPAPVETPVADQAAIDRIESEIAGLEADLDAARHKAPFTEPSN
jgi:hypothetical protein